MSDSTPSEINRVALRRRLIVPMRDCVVTGTGLRIGSAYTAPPPAMSDDAERIQQVLLTPEKEWPPLNRKTAVIAVLLVVFAAVVSALFPLGWAS